MLPNTELLTVPTKGLPPREKPVTERFVSNRPAQTRPLPKIDQIVANHPSETLSVIRHWLHQER